MKPQGQGPTKDCFRLQYKLNTRHDSFSDYISLRLDQLRLDLAEECERIAVKRELGLKMKLEKMSHQNEALQEQIRIWQPSNTVKADNGQDASTEHGETASASQVRRCIKTGPFLSNAVTTSSAVELPTVSLHQAEVQPSTSSNIDPVSDMSKVAEDGEDQEFCLWPEWTQPAHSFMKTMTETGSKTHESEYSLASRNIVESAWLSKAGLQGLDAGRLQASTACTITPYSCLALSWELFAVPLLLYDLTHLPMQVFWDSEDQCAGGGCRFISMIIIMYWTLDILLRLFVFGYVNANKQIELRRTRIIVSYLRRGFLIDLVLVLPDWISYIFDFPRNFALLRIFKLMRFMRLARLSKLKSMRRKLQDLIDSESCTMYFNLFWNILIALACCHYLACLWFWVGSLDKVGPYETWVTQHSIDGLDWQYQYLTSMHWALCQFSPGSMDVQPANIPERIVSIIVLVWGMMFFSLFVSGATQERMRLQTLYRKLDRDHWILRRYMKQHTLPRNLCMRVVRYIEEFVVPMMMHVQRKDVSLLDCLSRPLQLEVQAEIYFHTLLVHPFFAILKERSWAMASNLFSNVVAEILLARNDLLFEVGQICHEMFFVSQGAMGYLSNGSTEIADLQPRDWCCEQVIWVAWVHTGTCRAGGESHLLSVDSAKFRTELLEYSERNYVRTCAQAFLKDLNRCVASGVEISDLLRMDQQQPDSFVKACDVSASLS